MKSQIGNYNQDYNTLSSKKFLAFSAFTNTDAFTEKEQIKELIEAYYHSRITQAKEEGYLKAQKDIEEEILNLARSEIDNYISLVTRIADFVNKRVNDYFKKTINIIQTRTNFYFGTRRIKIMFIIQCDNDKEIEFADLLQGVEKEVFEKDNFFCELLFINTKEVKPDSASINNDFPLIRKNTQRGKNSNAKKQSAH